MRILITGSSGYIGQNLAEKLGGRYTLYVPSHRELELLDTEEAERFFKKHPVDVVVHCAVAGGSRKEEYKKGMLYDNLRMFFNLVRNKNYFKKMIHFGSGAEYDKRFPIKKVKEEDFDKKVPADEYGFYKYTCSKYIERVDNVINLRIFGLYGKYEDYRYRFISNAICRNILGLPITINKNVYFDYVYIDDFVKIVDYFISHKAGDKFYNIGRGEKIDLLTIAKKINRISDKKSDIIVEKKGLKNEYTCDNARLLRKLPNFSFTDFDETLKDIYNWHKSREDNLSKKIFLQDRE